MFFVKCFELKLLRPGISLIETVVGIGVSMIVLTVIASFATNLFVNSQRTYVKNSAALLMNILSDQVRMVELSLKYAKLEVNMGNTSFYPKNVSNTLINNKNTWQWICFRDNNQSFYRVNFNISGNSNTLEHNINFEYLSNINLVDSRIGRFHFVSINPNEYIGIFSIFVNTNDVNLSYSIRRSYFNDSVLGELVVFDLAVAYMVRGIVRNLEYLEPSKIVILRNDICVN